MDYVQLPLAPEDIALPPSPPPPSELGEMVSPISSPFPSLLMEDVSSSPSDTPTDMLSSPETPTNMRDHFVRPRARSPLSRGQLLRSQTTSAVPDILPPMQRAHSSPGLDSTGRFIVPHSTRRPASPLGPPGRRRSPLRTATEDAYTSGPTWSGLHIEPNIPEHAELKIITSHTYSSYPTSAPDSDSDSPSTFSSAYNTIPRSRRGPSSPLYHNHSIPPVRPSTAPTSSSNSPLLVAHRYASEIHPLHHAASFGSGSSMPSTPTSFRSRSPSISSLETIPDSPDAEEAARLEDEVVGEKGVVEDGEREGREPKRRSIEMRFAGKEKRKRWSVCGAERRGDFSLEVIEE